jgi:DNA repair exonuclease SbcCD ATPase subunit
LEIFVKDDKGERPIKSLSGGQKTVLKLAWILSVASKMKNKMLFLDETINSLDAEAVGRVADMIKDFVEFSNTKLYVVTHSKQIQDMDIWDDVILLDKIR